MTGNPPSTRPLNPWAGQPPDWRERVEVLAYEMSQDPCYEGLNAQDPSSCAQQLQNSVDRDVAEDRLPPRPSEGLVRYRLRRCLNKKRVRRARRMAEFRPSSDPTFGEKRLLTWSSSCARCVQTHLAQSCATDVTLAELVCRAWFSPKRGAPPLSTDERKKLSYLKLKIMAVCDSECGRST